MKISEIIREADSKKKRSGFRESRIDGQSIDSDSWESDGGRHSVSPDDSERYPKDKIANKETGSNNVYDREGFDKEGFNKQGVNRWGVTREGYGDYEVTGDLETDNKIWMELDYMMSYDDLKSEDDKEEFASAVARHCDVAQTRTVIERLDSMNYYYEFAETIHELLLHVMMLTGNTDDTNLWKEILEYSIRDIFSVPDKLLKNENFAISIIDAAASSAESIDKHYIRSGLIEDWNNNPVELMNDWAQHSPLGPKAKKHLSNCINKGLFFI